MRGRPLQVSRPVGKVLESRFMIMEDHYVRIISLIGWPDLLDRPRPIYVGSELGRQSRSIIGHLLCSRMPTANVKDFKVSGRENNFLEHRRRS